MPESRSEPWHELWATFSVRDHCRPQAFVAEVLLYDKLLIPVPPTGSDGIPPNEAGAEWERWKEHRWDPARQAQMLTILGDRCEAIPWTAARQAEWKAAVAKDVSDARRNGYFMTGSVMQRFAPAMAKTVVAVSHAHSLEELATDSGVRRRAPEERVPASSLLAVLGHELLVPGDPDDEDGNFLLLEQAVAVARDDEYRQRRKALYAWTQQFVREGATDARSVKAAVDDMQRLVDRLKTATRRQANWRWAKRFFSFLSCGAKAAALAGPPVAVVAGGGSALASVGSFIVDEGMPRVDEAAIPAAALILDARERLGIE